MRSSAIVVPWWWWWWWWWYKALPAIVSAFAPKTITRRVGCFRGTFISSRHRASSSAMLTLLSPGASCSHGSSCSQPVALDPSYAPDHQNYLCMNYTRPTPLPCRDTAHGWAPRWFDGKGRPRFIIYAWWPPATPRGLHAAGVENRHREEPRGNEAQGERAEPKVPAVAVRGHAER